LVTAFDNCFDGDTSLTGSAPTLWTLYPGATGTGCFTNCTGLSNYNDIPETWGGPAVSSSSSSSSYVENWSSSSSYSSSSSSSSYVENWSSSSSYSSSSSSSSYIENWSSSSSSSAIVPS